MRPDLIHVGGFHPLAVLVLGVVVVEGTSSS